MTEEMEEYPLTISKKGEITLPPDVVEDLGHKIIITFGPGTSLLLHGLARWAEREEQLLRGDPQTARALIGTAEEYKIGKTRRLYLRVAQRRRYLDMDSGPVILSQERGKDYWVLQKESEGHAT